MELPKAGFLCDDVFTKYGMVFTSDERDMLCQYLTTGSVPDEPATLVALLNRIDKLKLKVPADAYPKEFLSIKLQEEWYRNNLYNPSLESSLHHLTLNEQTCNLVKLTPELHESFTLIPYLHYMYTRSIYRLGSKIDTSASALVEKQHPKTSKNSTSHDGQSFLLHSFNRPYVKFSAHENPKETIASANKLFKARDARFDGHLLRESINTVRKASMSRLAGPRDEKDLLPSNYHFDSHSVMTNIANDVLVQTLTKAKLWDRVCIAGGFVLNHLIDCRLRTDYDLFIYGVDEGEANDTILAILEALNSIGITSITRSENAITIRCIGRKFDVSDVQIILRLYKTKSEIIHGFDVDCCCVLYDGSDVWMTKRAVYALTHMVNTVDFDRLSPSYELRLAKYAQRGFSTYIPLFDEKTWSSISYPWNKCKDDMSLKERKEWSDRVGAVGCKLRGLDVLLYHYAHTLNAPLVEMKSDYAVTVAKSKHLAFDTSPVTLVYSYPGDDVIAYKLYFNAYSRKKAGMEVKILPVLALDILQDTQGLFNKDLKYRVPPKIVWKTTKPGEQMTNTFHRVVLADVSTWYNGFFYNI